VLYGPAGCGKSHLARGLAESYRQNDPASPVVCLTAGEFAGQLAAAVERQQLGAWRNRIRSASLLVLEDLGQLVSKRTAQQELRHALDALRQRDALVVVTAPCLPALLSTLSPALRSRLADGLAVPIALPGPAARVAILERLARLRGLSLSKRAAQALSDESPSSVSALAGLIVQLETAAHTSASAIDADFVRRTLGHRERSVSPSVRDIVSMTAKYFGLAQADLKSPLRRHALVAARGVAIYLSRQLTETSLKQIGDLLGGRDHTTVLHGYRRTEKLIKRDPATRYAVAELKKLLLVR
jgi:chromosomal replication initiator protein